MPYVLDLETERKNRHGYPTLHPTVGTMEASPYHPDNKIVLYGMTNLKTGQSYTGKYFSHFNNDTVLIIGQNITFDLLWLLKTGGLKSLKNITIWDTMIAEYYLTGQQSKYASLDALVTKYGGTLKDDKIKAYWEADIETSDIPPNELKEYLKGDLKNTEIVFLAQLEAFKQENPNLLTLVLHVMKSRLLTTLMEFNGLLMDRHLLDHHIHEVRIEVDRVARVLQISLDTLGTGSKISSLNISKLLFGGFIKKKVKRPKLGTDGLPMFFKNGNPKYETVEEDHAVLGYEPHSTAMLQRAKNNNYWLLPNGVLEILRTELTTYKAIDLVNHLVEYRKLSKELSTYLEGYKKHIWPDDCRIHASFSHTATDTGRIASSNPNILNISGK